MEKTKSYLQARLLLGTAALALAASFAGCAPARASELWNPYLRGVNEGLAAGATPPPGVYGVLDNYWTDTTVKNNSGKNIPGATANILVEVPIVLWVPGIKILGASYSLGIAQPFDYTSAPGVSGHIGSGNWGTFNTVLIPGQLAWTLPYDYFVKTGLELYLPDASSTMPDLLNGKLNNGGLPSGNGYFAVQQDLGLSWLSDGWNISADMHLAEPVTADKTTGYNYMSGDQFSADYTLAKTIGAWTFGVGAHQMNQITVDTLNGVRLTHHMEESYGAGPMVGYQFGGINILASWDQNIYTKNDVAGTIVNVRLITKF